MAEMDTVKNDNTNIDNTNIDNTNIEESAAKEEDSSPKRSEKRKRNRKKNNSRFGSVMAKITAFFLLAVSSLVASAAVLCFVFSLENGLYSEITLDEVFENLSQDMVEDVASKLKDFIDSETEISKVEAYFASRNADVEVWMIDQKSPIWGTYDGSYEALMVADFVRELNQEHTYLYFGNEYFTTRFKYIFKVYLNPDLPENDSFRQVYEEAAFLYERRSDFLWAALGSGLISVLCFVFLMCRAGSGSDVNELKARRLQRVELDLIAAILGIAGVIYLEYILENQMGNLYLLPPMMLKSGAVALCIVWFTVCCYDIARQMKDRNWWQHTVIWYFCRGCRAFILSIPFIFRTLLIYLGLCAIEFMICLPFMRSEGILYLLLEKLILLPVIVYVALCCKKLLLTGRVLTEGRQDYKLDTSKMIGAVKEHGNNLNSISQGISKAVEEQLKSERLKTELFTNISHDLKTPLTSIINYSRLISEVETGNETVTEYSQVLLRQSERLKKLLEDLMEASKATTGNLEVNPVPCDVGVILSQAVGEYQHRLEEKELDLIISQPDEPIRIMADGKHLWRVFDNLLNNICKYAQESSRVYLNVDQLGERVLIIFRNMSKYALNIPADELEERFVRGDKSRHMEGNGLGLPIAKTLIELQNGKMEIVIDGDLFKVVISFDQLLE